MTFTRHQALKDQTFNIFIFPGFKTKYDFLLIAPILQTISKEFNKFGALEKLRSSGTLKWKIFWKNEDKDFQVSIYNSCSSYNLITRISIFSDNEHTCFAKFFCDYTYLHLIFVWHILKLFLHLWKHFINQNKNYTFMIRKNQSFCNQIFASYLLKCSVKILRIFIFIFFNFLLLFFKIFFI